MTRYEQGFLTKCAEHGVPFKLASGMLKAAQTNAVAQTSFQAPNSGGNITLDGSVGTVMQKGDTVSGVLKRLKIPQRYLWDVLKENGLTDRSARRLLPGHVIYTRPAADYAAQGR